MIGADLALVEKRSGRAYLYALAAARATGFSPVLMQVGDDHGVDAAAHHIPDVRAFNLGADPHAACAQDAAIVIYSEALMRCVDREFWIAIRQAHMGQTLLLGHRLQVAVTVRNANGADMIAFGEEQFENSAAVLLQPLRIVVTSMPSKTRRDAGRKQLVVALDLNHAQAASTHITEAVKVAQRRNVDVVFAAPLRGWSARRAR